MAVNYYRWTHPDHPAKVIYLPHRLVKVKDGKVYHLIHCDFTPNRWRESDEFSHEVDLQISGWEKLDLDNRKTKEWVGGFSALEIE